MIILWGVPEDEPLSSVYHALQELGSNTIFINQHSLEKTTIRLFVDNDVRGTLHFQDRTINLKSANSAYIRPYSLRDLYNIEDKDNAQLNHLFCTQQMISCWLELTSALVINKLSNMTSNNSKPYQANIIKSFGFEIPDTLITTDPKAVIEFWKYHDMVIYKSISSIRSIVSKLTSDHLERLNDISWCPTQFQEYIPGKDYRIHVVGEQIFACQITSNAEDYRYAVLHGERVDIIATDIPKHVGYKCKSLTQYLGLIVAGIDLKYSHDGKWYCFEVNPSPAFTYYQDATGQPIDQAIAHLLIKNDNKTIQKDNRI